MLSTTFTINTKFRFRQFSMSSTKFAGKSPTWPVRDSSPLYQPLSRFFCKITMSPTFNDNSNRELAGYFVTQRYRSVGLVDDWFAASVVVSRLLDFRCWALSWVFWRFFEVLGGPDKLMLCRFWAAASEFILKLYLQSKQSLVKMHWTYIGKATRSLVFTRCDPNCKFSTTEFISPKSMGHDPDLMWLYCSWLGFPFTFDDADESSKTGLSIE